MIIDFIIEDLMLNSYLQKNFHTLFYMLTLSLRLSFFFLFFFPAVNSKNIFNSLLGNQIFLLIFLYLMIFRISLFLFNQQSVKLLIQHLTGGDFLCFQLIKGLLCCFVKQNSISMFLKEFRTVSGLAVSFIGLAGLRVVVNMSS